MNEMRLPKCAEKDIFARQLLDAYESGDSVQNELSIMIDALANGRDYAETLKVVASSIEVDPMGYGFSDQAKKIAERIRRMFP